MGTEARNSNRSDNEDNKFKDKIDGTVAVDVIAEIDTTGTGPIPTEPITGNILKGVVFDAVGATYPSPTTEIYTYYIGGLAGALQATLTVIYTSSSKKFVTSVVKT